MPPSPAPSDSIGNALSINCNDDEDTKQPAATSNKKKSDADDDAAVPLSPVAAACKPAAMKEWIIGAINSLRDRNGLTGKKEIICSREYMTCALKIAHSLADELCAIEEHEAHDISYDEGGRDMLSSNKSWSHFISVSCEARSIIEVHDCALMNGRGGGLGDFEPIPYSNLTEPEDLQLSSLRWASFFLDTDATSPPADAEMDYLHVHGASLEENARKRKHFSDNRMTGMYSLGLVFFELFSGGQIPADELGRLHHSVTRLPAAAEQLSLHSTSHRSGGTSEENALNDMLDDEFYGSEAGGRNRRRKLQSDPNLDAPSLKTLRTPTDSISVEPLKLLGLPTALCDLIGNMVNSTNGDISGEETHMSMSDLRDDLKLMIDSPDVYLQDIDMVQAVDAGLKWERCGNDGGQTCSYGREAELETLKESYHRSISSDCEVAMICGLSGMGKSTLSQEFAEYVTAPSRNGGNGGAMFLSGRFDKLKQSQPFHAISSAFDKYCAWLSVGNRSKAEKITSALKNSVGEGVSNLVTVMPNLAGILGNDFANFADQSVDGAVDAQKRLIYLFCQFVDVISRCHKEPLILFLDDCQWIDSASIALLIQLMASGSFIENRRFFFFGCYRDDEVNEEHPLNSMLASMGTLGTNTTEIHLTSMSKDTVNKLVSTTLSLLPRLTRPLANILHHKTKGSPFFIKQLMIELYKQRLLYPSLIRRRWVWDMEKIHDMKIPESVATFIQKSFNRLPPEVLSALCVLSCFGASADISLIKTLEVEIQTPLSDPLDVAVAESIVDKRNGTYYFLHDKLQEAAYSVMKAEVAALQHVRFGLSLGFVAARENDDKLLITAVAQINHGGPKAVMDKEQGVAVAGLNLNAGKKAMAMSDFFSAYSFFDHGISYLRKGHWAEQYDLSLELFNLAATCAFTNADYTCLKILTQQIMRFAKCSEDKYQAITISITLLAWSGNIPDAISVIFDTLSSLGEEIPVTMTPSASQHQFDLTKAILDGITDEALLGYPKMEDPSKIMTMQLLVRLSEYLNIVGDNASLSMCAFKMIQISFMHGMSPLSPMGFAQYGNYLALFRGDFEGGYRYVKCALSLMKTMHSRAHDGEIIWYSTHTRLHVEPIQSAVELYFDGHVAALKSGATRYALFALYYHVVFSFWSGKKLDVFMNSMKQRSNKQSITKT
jgi:predicted ATPase